MSSVYPQQLPLFPVRVCTKCHAPKSLDDYYIANKKTGALYSWCKECHAAINKAAYTPHPLQPKPLPESKVCASCTLLLPIDAFSKRGRGESGVRSECRDCRRVKKAAYRAAHLDAVRASGRSYYAANAEACGARIRQSIGKNPTKYQAIHSDWKRRNKAAVNASTHKRRARLTGNRGWWTAADWERIKARQAWRCLMCGRQEVTDGITLCADHVVPLDKGGWNIAANLQGLCFSCNSLKYTRVLDLRPAFYS